MTEKNPPNEQNRANDPNSPQPPDGANLPAGNAPATPPPPHKRRWLRRTLYVLGGLVVLLIILVLLIPTIASMAWVRSIVVGKINDNINGKVAIADWSIGWTGGIKVDGIKVFDDQNRQILEIAHVSTQLSLVNAIKGKYYIGDTVIQGLDFNAIRYPDGTLNFQKLAKTSPSGATAPGSSSQTPAKTQTASKLEPAAKEESKPAETKLPDVRGQLRLVDCRGTVENITKDPATGQEKHDLVKFTSIKGDVKIPDINQPITDDLSIVEEAGNAGPGSLSVTGELVIAKNNIQLPPDQMHISQQITPEHVELAGFSFAFPPTITTLQGNTSGVLHLALEPGQGASFEGSVTCKGFKLGGPILEGDTYSADSAVITIPKSAISLAANGQTAVDRIRIGAGSGAPLTLALTNATGVNTSTSTIKFSADAPASALQNLADNKAPGANGSLRADVDVDLVPLAQMLPHMLHLWEGSKLDGGRIANTLELQMVPAQANLVETLAISPITGTGPENKKIAIDPVNLSLKSVDKGGLVGKLPDLRDIALAWNAGKDQNSSWTSGNITAANISSLKGQIHADLARAQAQLGQLIDMGDLKAGGTLDVALDSQGDLVNEPPAGQNSKAALSANVKLRNVVLEGLKDKPPVREPAVDLTTSANLERGKSGFAIRDLNTKLLAGNEGKPSINATITGNLDMSQGSTSQGSTTAPAAGQQSLQYALYVDLPQTQEEFGAFMKSLSDAHLQIVSGMLGISGTVNSDGKKAVVQPQFNINELSIDKDKTQHVLNHYNLALACKGPITYVSDNGNTSITISDFLLGDNANMIGIENANNQPIKLVSTKDGRMQPSAALHIIHIDLKQLNDLLSAFSAQAVATTSEGSSLKSGMLSGTANVASAQGNQIQLTGDLAVNNLTIAAPQSQGLQNEAVKLTLDMRAADDFSTASVNSLDAAASFLNAHVGNTQLVLKQGSGPSAQSVSTLDMLRSATAKVDVPSLAKLQVVMDAFSPPEKAASAAAQPAPAPQPARGGRRPARGAVAPTPPPPSPAEAPAPPSKMTGGSATLTLNATRSGDKLSIVPNLAVKDLVMKQGEKEEPIGNVDVTATEVALLINPPPASAPSAPAKVTAATTEPSIMDQVKELKLAQVTAKITGAELAINGSITDLGNARAFQGLGADLTYDAPKLWQFLVPLMFDPQTQAKWKAAKVAGSYKKHINIAGSYPTTLPSGQQPISLVAADGGITLDSFDGEGITLAKLEIPFNLSHGVFSIAYAGKPAGQNLPAPATLNGGTVDLGGASADMNGPHMLLNIPPAKALVHNVNLNPTFAQHFGDMINNPLFVTANNAAGRMDITINKCQNLPLDNTVTEPVPSNQGTLDATIVMHEVQLGNDTLQKISDAIASARVFGSQTINVKSLQGEIPNLHVVIDHGVTHNDMTMTLGEGKRPLRLTGDVAMNTRNMNMMLTLPWELFGIRGNQQLAALTSGGISLPLTGQVTNPQFDAGKAVQQNFMQGLLGGQGQGNQSTSKPSKEDNNPLNQLEDLLNRNKKKDK